MGKKSRGTKPAKQRMPFVARTFEGLPSEGDWVALREFVPSATAVVRLRDGGTVRICSLLPGAGAGLVRPDGEIWVGLQVMHNHGDISRDLAHVIETARETEPGTPIRMTSPGVGARLQDLIDPESDFRVELHEGFDWWLVEEDRGSSQAAAALEEANATVAPTTRLTATESAYVTHMGDHAYLRWIMLDEEGPLLDAFARLRAAGTDRLGEGTELIGIFRAHGLLVPVWELDGVGAEELDAAVPDFTAVLEEAKGSTDELTSEERTARRELVSRQVTIR
ncbi:preprotein translocase SecA [Aeromicrobium flavum]|uniref:Preprotein translocase SecA n=1 Tax=Aeromicrobium flavum TaxID=416568 RepID=A0A512HU59_9ACTN|nr:DUF5926 family protein [Aeromicrobium flavum]GEO88940.1 preprotein translocase SecA [Aeromicrobium flavum]